MANILKPKRSNTAAKVPTTTDLASGEIGVNMADQKVYINNGTSVVQVGAGKLSGHVDVTLTSLATGQTLQWNGTAWVNTTGGSGTVTGVTATAPVVSSGGTAPVISMAAATASVNGYMTSTYAAKLDGIASGATANTGTVTSVGGTGTVSGLSLSGTVTTSGNLTLGGTLAVTPSNFASQTANYVLAAPNGSAGTPTFRALVAADIPALTLENLPDAWVKRAVKVATTANITLSGTQTIDGVAVVAGDRVLVKDQTAGATNGIYVVAAGAWARSTDADTISELAGSCVSVDSGTTNGGFRFDTDLKTTDTLGTTAIVFARVYDTLDSATANTANKLVLRDASGNFSAGTITAALSGNATTATTLQTGRTIGITGDITYTSPSFNGSGNVTAAATLATVNANVGSFGSATSIPVVTVNAKGLVTAVSTATVAGGQYFGAAATKAIAYNANTISENVTVTAGNNGLSAGPITISTGYTVTVETGAAWVIV